MKKIITAALLTAMASTASADYVIGIYHFEDNRGRTTNAGTSFFNNMQECVRTTQNLLAKNGLSTSSFDGDNGYGVFFTADPALSCIAIASNVVGNDDTLTHSQRKNLVN